MTARACDLGWSDLGGAVGLFEFGFGHYVEGDSRSDLLESYDITEGNLWILILLWTAAGPRPFAPSPPSGRLRPSSARCGAGAMSH